MVTFFFVNLERNIVRRFEMAELQLIVLITKLFTRDNWHSDKEANNLQ